MAENAKRYFNQILTGKQSQIQGPMMITVSHHNDETTRACSMSEFRPNMDKTVSLVIFMDKSNRSSVKFHFNLLIFEKHHVYIFEPARKSEFGFIVPMIRGLFPDRDVTLLNEHPQKNDQLCLAYVTMLAKEVLEHHAHIPNIAYGLFVKTDTKQDATQFDREMRRKMALPELVEGHGDHYQEHLAYRNTVGGALDPLGVFEHVHD